MLLRRAGRRQCPECVPPAVPPREADSALSLIAWLRRAPRVPGSGRNVLEERAAIPEDPLRGRQRRGRALDAHIVRGRGLERGAQVPDGPVEAVGEAPRGELGQERGEVGVRERARQVLP